MVGTLKMAPLLVAGHMVNNRDDYAREWDVNSGEGGVGTEMRGSGS